MIELKPSQKQAVNVHGRTLLVSAAAGSGKTFTLTQRIIKSIIEDDQDLSRLLIVTFTRAAAGELKAKISRALTEAIAEHPDKIHLQKQLIKLGSAHISTIDAFFSEPVRANFERLGLPASMRLSDNAELAPIRDKILQDTLEEFFGRCAPYAKSELSPVGYEAVFTDLINIISSAREGSNILPEFLNIYKKLITSPRGLGQLKDHAARLKAGASLDFFDTNEGRITKNEIISDVKYIWKTFVKLSEDMQSDKFVASKYSADFIDNASACHSLLIRIENGNYSEVQTAFEGFKPSRLTSIKEEECTEESLRYKNERANLNKRIKSILTSRLYKTQAELSELFCVYSSMCELMYEILSSFDKSYTAEKKRRGICEFSDMPKYMLELLLDENGEPTEYAKSLSASFDEVYIDEYQDVNEIQDTIFSLIGGSRRFMVGDIKQSIYGFREAEPSIFASYRKKFPIYDESSDQNGECCTGGSTIMMSENFRCDENVIEFTNAVCSDVFSAFSESVEYTEADDLKFSKALPYPNYKSPRVKLNIVQKPDIDLSLVTENEENDKNGSENTDKLWDEAVITANEIADLVRKERDANGDRITLGDITILVRSGTALRPLLKALNEVNIKYLLSSKGDIFENEDMRLLVDILSVIDNPRDDIPLYHVLTAKNDLYSPYLSLEDVIKARRLTDSSSSLYDAILACSGSDSSSLGDSCRRFITLIEKMRLASNSMSADKLIKSLISSDAFAPLTGTAAFTYLYDAACRYVKNTWSSLYSFINYFKGMMKSGDGGAEPVPSDGDAIRIMTIHQSKGLEFKVCFIFGAGREFNDKSDALAFNKDLGLSMKLPARSCTDSIEKISTRYENNPIYQAFDRHIKIKLVEEEARILYVALTRARERLYISATLGKTFELYTQRLRDSVDPAYEIKKGVTYINWILMTLMQGRCREDVFKLQIHDRATARLTEPLSRNSISVDHYKLTPEEEEYASVLRSAVSETDMASIEIPNIPSKVAASKVSSHMLDDSIFVTIPTGKHYTDDTDEDAPSSPARENKLRVRSRIELMRSSKKDFDSLLEVNKKPTSAEIGSAAHAFLQFCDYKNAESNGIENEIERLRENKFITERTASIINIYQLKGFFKSTLYSFIKDAASVRREFHFGMFRDASDFTEDKEMVKAVSGKKIYVQGSIDLIIEKRDGGLILCDYKTDRITPEERKDRRLLQKNMKERHGEQLEQYAYAVKRIFGKEPENIFIYSLALQDSIEIK